MADILDRVAHERMRQDAKWGVQRHERGTGSLFQQARAHAQRARVDKLNENFTNNWFDILLEEVFEAGSEKDAEALKRELIQVAAVAVAWAEAIDDGRG